MSELDQYDYTLPKELIAQDPLPNRVDARLMLVDRASGSFEHRYVRDLPEILRPGDCLVYNDTRVVPARLVGRRTLTGGRWEGLFLHADARGFWQLLCRTRGKLAAGETVTLYTDRAHEDVRLRMIEKFDDGVWLAHPESEDDAFEILDRVGRVPLPKYIRRGEMIATDRENYQTVFAQKPGSVAAPTAGLHFTEKLLDQLNQRDIECCSITLHIGLDTFRPIKSKTIEEHPMHSEWGQITPEIVRKINPCRARGCRVVAVGTTTVRVLETAARGGTLEPWRGKTDLFIRPPFEFRAVDVLLTNFHLPRTTLLILVRTFGGDQLIRQAYAEAVEQQYRFYSYGDAMLIQ